MTLVASARQADRKGIKRSTLRRRFWIESGLSVTLAISAVVTALIPDWVEVFFHVEPDEGAGTFEVGVTMALLVIAVAVALTARLEFKRGSLVGSRPAAIDAGDR